MSHLYFFVIGLALAVAIAIQQAGFFMSSRLPTNIRLFVILLRSLAAGVLLLVLFDPAVTETSPARDGYRFAVLVDDSRSLLVTDAPGGISRREAIQRVLNTGQTEGFLNRLSQKYPLDLHAFADGVQGTLGTASLQGATAIGDALDRVLKGSSSALPLGGVLLISDGRSVAGTPPLNLAKAFAGEGIPVSTAAIGETAAGLEDLALVLNPLPEPSERASFTVSARLENKTLKALECTVQLFDGTQMIQSKTVALASQETADIPFTVDGASPGAHLYTLKVAEKLPADENPLNNDASGVVRVPMPSRFRVLFAAEKVGPELKFLRQLSQESSKIDLCAFVNLGQQKRFLAGFDEEPEAKTLSAFLSDTETVFEFESLILSLSDLNQLPEKALQTVFDFVDKRGGGLLVQVDSAAVPERLGPLASHASFKPAEGASTVTLNAVSGEVFQRDRADALLGKRPLVVPSGSIFCGNDAKLSSIPLLKQGSGSQQQDVASRLRFGPGRVAWLGWSDTWLLRLSHATGYRQHQQLWESLLEWLSRDRLTRFDLPSEVFEAQSGEALELSCILKNRDFSPAESASVEVVLKAGNQETSLSLSPDGKERGSFSLLLRNPPVGSTEATFVARFADGEVLRKNALLFVRPDPRESLDVTSDRRTLMDIARITGGRFAEVSDLSAEMEFPVSSVVPQVEEKIYPMRNGFWLLLLVAVLSAEWYLRRRSGLR